MPEDLSAIIKKRIGEFQSASKVEEVGTVIESGDGIIRIKGLPGALAGEMVEFPGKIFGMVFNLEREDILAVLLGPHTAIKEGDLVKSTGRVMEVPVGEGLIGRVVDAIGEPIDGLGPIKTKNFRPVERLAPGVIDRTPVSQPLQTGYKLIDALIPIGRGQRELIIGDRSTGKSTLAIDAILNQKGENVVCVYVAIGQKEANILQVIETLREHGAMDYTIVVSASASKPAQPSRMTPPLRRPPPGREAFPGDVFYLPSRLLERSAKLRPESGGGSLTALPIIETQLGDVTAYIPTNVISITDGQIFLEEGLFNAGVRPPLNAGHVCRNI